MKEKNNNEVYAQILNQRKEKKTNKSYRLKQWQIGTFQDQL